MSGSSAEPAALASRGAANLPSPVVTLLADAGVVVPAEVGTHIKQGDAMAEIVDPFPGVSTQLMSPVDGVLYAREIHRYVRAGTDIAKVAGVEALRTGDLLAD